MATQKVEMTRSVLAKHTGVNLETIRYYEKIGLLLEPKRSSAHYRLYSQDDLKRVMFIRRCRELGYTLDEIRNLLDLVDNRTYTCDQVKALTLERLGEVQTKIKDLKKISRTLASMAKHCEGGTAAECHVIDVLTG